MQYDDNKKIEQIIPATQRLFLNYVTDDKLYKYSQPIIGYAKVYEISQVDGERIDSVFPITINCEGYVELEDLESGYDVTISEIPAYELVYEEPRKIFNKDELICKYNNQLEMTSNIPPIMLATDTYDMLRNVQYNENEALKLTEIICNNYFEKEKIRNIESEDK